MKNARYRATVVAGLTALVVLIPTAAQQPAKPGKGSQALQEREKAMAQLASDSKQALDRLQALTSEQKNAVIALMAITRASAAYESRFLRKDDASLRSLYDPLSKFSPAYRAPASFNRSWMTACFDQTVSCLSAQKKCRDKGGSEDQCDRKFDVIEACGNEAACITREFLNLHKGIPTILGGRDPWPPKPQPFPY
jgi:hypothetical protein